MLKKVKKFVFGVGTLTLMATVVAGCSESPKYVNETEDKLTSNLKEVMKNNEGINLEKFEILAVDVEKSGFTFDIIFNGVAGFENKEKAYVSINYETASEVFVNLKKNSSREDLFKVFSDIVNTHEIKDYSITNVKNFEEINNAIVNNTPSPFKGYSISQGLTYHISSPVFDDKTNEITFDVKNLVKVRQGRSQAGAGLAIGFDGSVGIGIGVFYSSKNAALVVTDKYTINARNLNYEDLKNNPEKIFEYFINATKEKDDSFITAERLNINDVTYQNANDLSIKLKNIDKEMGN